MKHLTLDEFRDLLAGGVEHLLSADEIEMATRALVDRAAAIGVVVTVEQRSVEPLAMGRLETVVSVRPARTLA